SANALLRTTPVANTLAVATPACFRNSRRVWPLVGCFVSSIATGSFLQGHSKLEPLRLEIDPGTAPDRVVGFDRHYSGLQSLQRPTVRLLSLANAGGELL